MENVAVAEQAIGEASCATAPADATFEQSIQNYVSPRTYSARGCYKATVVDAENIFSGNPEGAAGWAEIEWFDARPTTQSACENLWLQGYYYDWDGASWVKTDLGTARGVWSGGYCSTPRVELWHDQGPYRIVASARTAATSGAATRSLRICEPCHILPPPP